MKNLVTIASLIIVGLFLSSSINAQTKFGYINSGELMQLMPETKKANAELETFAKTLEDQLEKMKKDFEVKYADYVKNEKTMSEAIKEVKQSELKNADENMQGFSQKAQDQISQKREALLTPIMNKADANIKEVAKANNIAYVFDTSSAGILVAPPGDDMLPLMKAKLGLKDPAVAPTKPQTPAPKTK